MSAGLSLVERMALREPLPDDMTQAAERLFPDSDYLQHEWQRAVGLVRSTSGGWLLERAITKQETPRARKAC
jgi:hypothetical protein